MPRIICLVLIAIMLLVGATAFAAAPTSNAASTADLHRANDTARQLIADKRYADAVAIAVGALRADPNSVDLWITYGDACNAMTAQNLEYMQRARESWARALEIDPRNLQALDRLMEFWTAVTAIDTTRPAVFEELHTIAARLCAIDPSNTDAEIAVQTSIVRPWVLGLTKDDAKVQPAIDQLALLHTKYPKDVDATLLLAQAKVKRADALRAQQASAEADRLDAEANQLMDASVAQSPSASMFYAAAQFATTQERLAMSRGDDKQVSAFRQKKLDAFNHAIKWVRPEGPQYTAIYIDAARANAKDGREAILRAAYQAKPDDQEIRLALAEQLAVNPKTRSEAASILDLPVHTSQMTGPRAYLIRELKRRGLCEATNIQLAMFKDARDETEKAQLLDRINALIGELELRGDSQFCVLMDRGKLLRLQGNTIEAIQILEKARALAEGDGNSGAISTIDRWEVVDMLARAYIDTKQTGRARDLLRQLVEHFPGYDPARVLLAQVLIQGGELDEARPHVAYLVRKLPTEPDVLNLKIQLLQRGAPATGPAARAELDDAFAALPESNVAQILDKVSGAMVIERPDEAIRLLKKAQTSSPGDYQVARTAVRVYRATGDLPAARAAVDAALHANPADTKLQILHQQVQDLTPEGLAKVALNQPSGDRDPATAAIIRANAYRQLNKPDEQLKCLLEAKKLKPDNPDVDSLLFSFYLEQKQFDQAEPLIDGLAKRNQDQCQGELFRYRLAMARSDYKTAETHARVLVRTMGAFSQSWVALGKAMQATGQFDAAVTDFSNALQRQQDCAEAYVGLIECCEALGRPTDAARWLEAARRTLPNDPSIKQLAEHQHAAT